MDTSTYVGKWLAVVMVFTQETGEEEWATFCGPILARDGVLFVDRGEHGPAFEILDEWVPRIRTTPAAASEALDSADYYLKLFGGPKPNDEDPSEFVPTGLKWPD
jgi:hypothetical protein